MNYERHYNLLMLKAQAREELEGYFEVHHIMPRCLGGSDDQSNLVSLTPEEHYLAHQLLAKMHSSNPKLLYAAIMMTGGVQRSNKMYGWLRRRLSEANKGNSHALGNKMTEEQIDKWRKTRALNSKPYSEETIAKMRKAKVGKPLSEAHKEALRNAAKNRKAAPPVSDETRMKMRNAKLGTTLSDETKLKVKEARAGRKPALGHKHSAEAREAAGAVHRGKTKSPEQRQKMAEARRAWWANKKAATQ